HPAAGDEAALEAGVAAAEVGELHEVLAVDQEQLGYALATRHRARSRPVGKEDIQDLRACARDVELRDDARTGDQGRGRDLLLGALAIRLDLKGLRIHRPVEDDRSAVEKAET